LAHIICVNCKLRGALQDLRF